MISKTAQREIKERTREAFNLLASLREGDAVLVTQDGRESTMYVSRDLHRADGAYGSWEGSRVTVTFGPGRYSREISADAVGNGYVSIVRPTV